MNKDSHSLRDFWNNTKAADYSITDLVHADCRALAQLHSQTFARPWTDGEFENLLEDKNVTGLALRKVEYQAPDAFLLMRTVPKVGEAEVLTFMVQKERQGRGLGYKLLEGGVRRLENEGLSSLFLEVDEANAPALKLYKKVGFEIVGNRPGYYQSHGYRDNLASNALVMELKFR